MRSVRKERNVIKERSERFSTVPFWKTSITLAVLLLAGSILNPVESKLWGVMKENLTPASIHSLQSQTSEGLVLATLGGFRSIIADIQWLQTMNSWEKQEKEKTIGGIQFTVGLDPRPTFFWLNGGRMLAYDMRHWDADLFENFEERRKEEIRLANMAIDFLKLAIQYHPETVSFPIEIANIYLNRLGNLELAAEYYHKAYTEYDDSPYYVGRLYALILAQMGEYSKAYDFLTQLYRELPSGDIYANKPIVLSRIRALEKKINLPREKRFRPQ